MSFEKQLIERSGNACELCRSTNTLSVYAVPTDGGTKADNSLWLCEKCMNQLDKKVEMDPSLWSCLRDSMWSDVPAVQVVSWRMLNRMKQESWAADLIDQMYLDDENLEWAKASGDHLDTEADALHRDSNGTLLSAGDAITLIKSLDVKGSQVNAKIGTVVKNIKLVAGNAAQIEGKIEGQQIVILTKFVRKAS